MELKGLIREALIKMILGGARFSLAVGRQEKNGEETILVCPLLWLEETLDGEQRALGELVE